MHGGSSLLSRPMSSNQARGAIIRRRMKKLFLHQMRLYFVLLLLILFSTAQAGKDQPIRYKDTELWGLMNTTGEILCPAQFDQIGWFDDNGIAIVEKNGLVGLISNSGEVIAEPRFSHIFNAYNKGLKPSAEYGSYVVQDENGTGCITTDGSFVRHNAAWNTCGNDFFSGLTMIVSDQATRKGNFVRLDGSLVFDEWWEAVYPLSAGGGVARRGDTYAIITSEGEIAGTFEWSGSISCAEDYVILCGKQPDSKWGMIDLTDSAIVIEPEYEYIDTKGFKENLLRVKKDGLYGFLDRTGEVIISPQFDYAESFQDGVAYVQLDEKNGYIDQDGRLLFSFPTETMWIADEYEGIYFRYLRADGTWGFLNREGEVLSEISSNITSDSDALLANGLFPACGETGYYGFLNVYGDWVIWPQWDSATNYTEGFACVEKDYQVGIIDAAGKLVVEPVFNAYDCSLQEDGETYFVVKHPDVPDQWSVCDVNGEVIAPYMWNIQ